MSYTYNREEILNRVFNFLYGCAFQDAVSQKSFKGKKNWIITLDGPKQILRLYIDKVLKGEFSSKEEHDHFFLETANKLCTEINGNQPAGLETDIFSFGNAQKLINIAVKHTYTFCYQNPDLRAGFRFCHCPIDAIILQKVWDLCQGKISVGTKLEFCKPWGAEGIVDGKQPELTEFPSRYDLFQRSVRTLIDDGDLLPIEFDYLEWKG